jgi:hypothetical protein
MHILKWSICDETPKYNGGGEGLFSPGVKQPVREDDYSPPASAEFKNARSCTSTYPMSSWRGAYLSAGDLPLTLLYQIKATESTNNLKRLQIIGKL